MRSILEFNSRFAVACLAVLSWIALREQVFGTPSGLSVLIEWLGLMVVAICLSAYARTGSRWLRVCASIAVSAFVIRSILERQTVPGYPAYWGGFGVSVLLAVVVVCGLLVMICSVVTVYQHPIFGVVRRMSKSVLAVLVWLGIGWILPTLIQPFDAWLNVGDSTEKFLDEIAGWVSGRIPGVGIGWHHNSLLGLPLGPMHFVSGFGVEKITMIVVFVNCLVLLVPVTVAYIIRQVLPILNWTQAFVLALISVAISGDSFNHSIFQELSFLARLLAPLMLGALVITASRNHCNLGRPWVLAISILAALTLWNNIEFGFGAAAASLIVVWLGARDSGRRRKEVATFSFGFLVTTLAILLPGMIHGGMWFSRRLGGIGDVFFGDMSINTYNNLGPIPMFSLTSIWFALAIATLATGIRVFLGTSGTGLPRRGTVSSIYFGAWSLLSAPYFLHNGGSGSFRTQVLLLPVTILTCSALGSCDESAIAARDGVAQKSISHTHSFERLLGFLPLALLFSLSIASIVQVPIGTGEWQRIQSPVNSNQPLDEWSPNRLDWIEPSHVLELANQYGGSSAVGWWFAYGNAIEILTGVENVFGISGFENIRSPNQFRLSCEPLLESTKEFVLSFDNMAERMRACGLTDVRALTSPNGDGLVVYKISRT